jgi:hypothetical protein
LPSGKKQSETLRLRRLAGGPFCTQRRHHYVRDGTLAQFSFDQHCTVQAVVAPRKLGGFDLPNLWIHLRSSLDVLKYRS